MSQNKKPKEGWGGSSVVKHLSGTCEILGSVPCARFLKKEKPLVCISLILGVLFLNFLASEECLPLANISNEITLSALRSCPQ